MKIPRGSTVWFHGDFFDRHFTCLSGIALEEGQTGVAKSTQVEVTWANGSTTFAVPGNNIYIVRPCNLPT